MNPPSRTDAGARPEAEELFPVAALVEHLGVARLALFRHWRLAALCFACAVAASALAVAVAPRSFHSQATILIARNAQAQALGTPDRTFPREEEPPTRGAADLVLELGGLQALADELLAASPPRPGLRARLLGRKPDAQAPSPHAALVESLEKSVVPAVEAERGVLTIDVDWGDPKAAAHIADRLSRRFIERRRALEVESLARTLAVLEEHAGRAKAEVEGALRDASALQERSNRKIASAAQSVGDAPASGSERERARTLQALTAARTSVAGLEEAWRKRRSEVRAAFEELRARYTPGNPALREAQERLRNAERPPPELGQAQAEADRLLQRFLAQGGVASDVVDGGAARRGAAQAAASGALLSRDPEVLHALRRLETAEANQAALASRLEAARVEYETAREAFPGRYVLLKPARVPTSGTPSALSILLAGALGGVLLALLAVLLSHLKEGRLVRTRQLERELGVPVLGEVELPSSGGAR